MHGPEGRATNGPCHRRTLASRRAGSHHTPMLRDYAALTRQLPTSGDRTERMRAVVDLLWDAFHAQGVSWVGFYTCDGGDEMLLGPRRDKPACSPIGLHGACGRAYREGVALVVRDVKALGTEYIACDPRDRSELVIPLFEPDGRRWGVLDMDSFEVGAFDESDATAASDLLHASGLTSVRRPPLVSIGEPAPA